MSSNHHITGNWRAIANEILTAEGDDPGLTDEQIQKLNQQAAPKINGRTVLERKRAYLRDNGWGIGPKDGGYHHGHWRTCLYLFSTEHAYAIQRYWERAEEKT